MANTDNRLLNQMYLIKFVLVVSISYKCNRLYSDGYRLITEHAERTRDMCLVLKIGWQLTPSGLWTGDLIKPWPVNKSNLPFYEQILKITILEYYIIPTPHYEN